MITKDKKAIFPDSNGVMHRQPIDPETDKEMKGYLQNHPAAKKKRK